MIGRGRPLVPKILYQSDRVGAGAKSSIFTFFSRSQRLSRNTYVKTVSENDWWEATPCT